MTISLTEINTSADLSAIIAEVAEITNRTDANARILAGINSAIRKLEMKRNYEYMAFTHPWDLNEGDYTIELPTRVKKVTAATYAKNGEPDSYVPSFYDYNESSDAWARYPDPINDIGEPESVVLDAKFSLFTVRPTADALYPFTIKGYRYSAPLDLATNYSHFLISTFKEVLLFGALMELMPVIKDWDHEVFWRSRFKEAVSLLNIYDDELSRSLQSRSIKGAY